MSDNTRTKASHQKTLLHVGCGLADRDQTHHRFHPPEWKHVRIDIDPAVKPDVVADIKTLDGIEDASADGIYSCHNLEHLHYDDVFLAMKAFYRVLKDRGHLVICVPNFELACERVAEGKGLEIAYVSPVGPITPLDMIFGYRMFTRDNPWQYHRTGFTQEWLEQLLIDQGFIGVEVVAAEAFNLWAFARKMA